MVVAGYVAAFNIGKRQGRCVVRCSERSVVVVGGGAAGFFAAIHAARGGLESVTILESGREALHKVKISGGGRCNTTHAAFDQEVLARGYPRGMRELRGPFSKFDSADTVKWFKERGIELKTEEDGRMFPVTDDSSTIVNGLLTEARNAGVKLLTCARVSGVQHFGPKERFKVNYVVDGTTRHKDCDVVLVATGSSKAGYKWAEALGHRLVDPIPSLFTFNVRDEELVTLAGVSVTDTRVRLVHPGRKKRRRDDGLEQRGPTLITHWGLSGPAVLRLSAFGARVLFEHGYETEILIDWLPTTAQPDTLEQLSVLKEYNGARTASTSSPFKSIPARLWKFLVARAGVSMQKRWNEVKNNELREMAKQVHTSTFHVVGKGAFKEEFVTSGGVNLKDIDLRTMESKVVPRLFFAGEVCDYDGITGGFNLQGAWTTGYIAGEGILAALAKSSRVAGSDITA